MPFYFPRRVQVPKWRGMRSLLYLQFGYLDPLGSGLVSVSTGDVCGFIYADCQQCVPWLMHSPLQDSVSKGTLAIPGLHAVLNQSL